MVVRSLPELVCGAWRPPGAVLPLRHRVHAWLLTCAVVQAALLALHAVCACVLRCCCGGGEEGAAAALRSPPRRFVLLAAPRTGSTLLLGLLRAHPAVHAMGEILNPAFGYFGDVTRCSAARQGAHVRALLGWSAALPAGMPNGGLRRGVVAVGAKVFGEHLEACGMELRSLLAHVGTAAGAAAAAAAAVAAAGGRSGGGPGATTGLGRGGAKRPVAGVVVVVLYRRCLLDAFVSLQRAFATEQWCRPAAGEGEGGEGGEGGAAAPPPPSRPPPLELDWCEFARWAMEVRDRWARLAQQLRAWRGAAGGGELRRVLVLEYEELAEPLQRPRAMRRVCAALGVSGEDGAVRAACAAPPLLRQRTQRLEDAVRNYHALRLDEVRHDPAYCVDLRALLHDEVGS